eukprot:TRINITY_DN16898_c0_g1_i1.p1 TRINITY_DN16898_c0_g1~~TRINITY_DN16898_c0_g1_i1.p1  ORF type:complete len:595 (-),score=140.30 TRINITY_DN16898_c0_g1_i1:138-1922(-)
MARSCSVSDINTAVVAGSAASLMLSGTALSSPSPRRRSGPPQKAWRSHFGNVLPLFARDLEAMERCCVQDLEGNEEEARERLERHEREFGTKGGSLSARGGSASSFATGPVHSASVLAVSATNVGLGNDDTADAASCGQWRDDVDSLLGQRLRRGADDDDDAEELAEEELDKAERMAMEDAENRRLEAVSAAADDDAAALASGVVQAMVHDHAVMKRNLSDYDTALRATLAEARRLQAEVLQMERSCSRVAELRSLIASDSCAQAKMNQQNAILAAKNEELLSILHSCLDASVDVETDAFIEALVSENCNLWRLVQISEETAGRVSSVPSLYSSPPPSLPSPSRRLGRSRSSSESTASKLTSPNSRPFLAQDTSPQHKLLSCVGSIDGDVVSATSGRTDGECFRGNAAVEVCAGRSDSVDGNESTSKVGVAMSGTGLAAAASPAFAAAATSGYEDLASVIGAESCVDTGTIRSAGREELVVAEVEWPSPPQMTSAEARDLGGADQSLFDDESAPSLADISFVLRTPTSPIAANTGFTVGDQDYASDPVELAESSIVSASISAASPDPAGEVANPCVSGGGNGSSSDSSGDHSAS